MAKGKALYNEIYQAGIDAGLTESAASVMADQAMLETGWGKSVSGNNYFGIKAGSSWTGATKTVGTWEGEGGKVVRIKDKFRAYDSVKESIADRIAFMDKRFPGFNQATSREDAYKKLRIGGKSPYATDGVEKGDPLTYTDKLESISRRAGKPVPKGYMPEVGSEMSTKSAPIPLNKTSKVAAVQLLNGMRGADESVITGNQTPKPLPRSAGDQARAKAANQDMRQQPGFLSTVLESAGILPSMSSGVKPLTFENDVRSKKAPVEGLIKLRPGQAPTSTSSESNKVRPLATPTAAPKSSKSSKSGMTESMGTAIGRYRLPTAKDLEYRGSVPNVNRGDEEFTRSVLNGYREIQHMGPSSKGAKATPQAAATKKPGATKTTAPSQDPIPRGVRPQVQVGGVDQNKRVTDPVSTRSHLTRNARAATVAATSLLRAGLVSPQVARTVLSPEGVFLDGIKAPTPMDRIRGDKAREKSRANGPETLPGRRPDTFMSSSGNGVAYSNGRATVPKKSSSSGSSSSGQSTPAGYTRISSTSFVSEDGGVYYDRHLNR